MPRPKVISTSERNAVVLFHRGDLRSAAIALGWEPGGKRGQRDLTYEPFIREEIERIRRKVKRRRAAIAPPEPEEEKKMTSATVPAPPASAPSVPPASEFELQLIDQIDGRVAELEELIRPSAAERRRLLTARRALIGEEPERLDEREAQPLPPPGEKLDEKEPLPPPADEPPIREDDPEDKVIAGKYRLSAIRAYVEERFSEGSWFRTGELRNEFPGLTGEDLREAIYLLIGQRVLKRKGERAATRYALREDRPSVNGSGG